MNSLKIKIIGLIAVIMVGAIGLIAWFNLQTQSAMLANIAKQNGRLLGETIRNSIHSSMKSGENEQVKIILGQIAKDPSIGSVKIFDETGRVLISANKEEIGSLVSTSDLLAYRSKQLQFTETVDNRDYFNTLIPIANASECYSCHDREQQTLGILSLHLSLQHLDELQLQGKKTTILSSIVAFCILIIAITIFIILYVDAPIRKLVASMKRVEGGEFESAAISIKSSDEMSELAQKFNSMVGRLKFLIDSTIRHECELAVNREQLAHHNEIQSMNITLEERLKEIEYLNISLEERIEEIEEANYKIADLASDLETKNTTLEKTVARLSALNKMGFALNSTMDIERLFDILIRRTIEAIHARIGHILLMNNDQRSMRVGGAIGLPDYITRNSQIPLQAGGVSQWVVENRQPLLIEKMDGLREFNKVSKLGYTRETIICAPLIIKDEIIGTIGIANKIDGTSFTAEDLELLSTIAAQASVAIKNARLYEEQQTTYLSTVQALVSAIEASDAYTRGHSERVTRYAQLLGKQLDLSPLSLKRLEHAAILHDIGKIGIDLTLLHKQGQLSANDVNILQQHPLIGARILEPINFLDGVREIIIQHHERYDGYGYPFRIQGETILFEARILAVADTYDAMTSDRPYRKALSHETALKEIQDHAGTQFDPVVAAAMTTLCVNSSWPTC